MKDEKYLNDKMQPQIWNWDIQNKPKKMQYKAAVIGKGIEAKIAPNFPVEWWISMSTLWRYISATTNMQSNFFSVFSTCKFDVPMRRVIIPKTEKKIMKAADI